MERLAKRTQTCVAGHAVDCVYACMCSTISMRMQRGDYCGQATTAARAAPAAAAHAAIRAGLSTRALNLTSSHMPSFHCAPITKARARVAQVWSAYVYMYVCEKNRVRTSTCTCARDRSRIVSISFRSVRPCDGSSMICTRARGP